MALTPAVENFMASMANYLKAESNTESNSSNKNLALLALFVIGVSLVGYFSIQNTRPKKVRDQDGFTAEDRIKKEKVWDTYAQAKLLGLANLSNQTQLFFDAIGKKYNDEFKSSSRKIIQFGISTGDFVQSLRPRKVIGYDYSSVALNALSEEKTVETRLVNLNAIKDNKLTYQAQLETDFATSVDVLFVRILEYLDPEAVQLLMLSLINLAKPGSHFYIEIASPPKNVVAPSGDLTVIYALKPGTILSMFADRKDFKVEVLDHTKNDNDKRSGTVERLLIEKLRVR